MTASRTRRPSVLAVTSEPPWPLDTGGHLRSYHVMRMLARRFDVRLVAPMRAADDSVGTALAAAGLQPRLVPVAQRTALGEGLKIARAALRHEPYVMFSRHYSDRVAAVLRDESGRQRPDVIYLDHLDSLVYARRRRDVPIVVDMHNVYSRLARRAAAEAGSVLRGGYLKREAALIARMERRAVDIADTILTVSHEEARYFAQLGARRVVVVPNGVDCAAYDRPAAAPGRPPTILYVGSLAWPPNASAARFLATDVLPAVRRVVADARLVIVGRNPAPELRAVADADAHIHLAANVPDVTPYFLDADVLAVPLEAGGGTRLKILEAFAAGLPVISTPIGCEGIAAEDGRDLVVADRGAFASAIVALLRDPARRRDLAAQALALARGEYDWSIVGAVATDAVASAITRAPAYSQVLSGLAIETGVTTQ